MVASNLTFDIFPNSRVESNPPLALALEMERLWVPGTFVYYNTFNTDDWTIRYFNPETTWKKWDSTDLAALEAQLQQIQRNAGSAWLDTTALDLVLSMPGGSEWLGKHTPGTNQNPERGYQSTSGPLVRGRPENDRFELVNNRRRIIFQRIGPA